MRYTNNEFAVLLNEQDWNDLYNLTHTNDLWELMLKYITVSLNKLAPMRNFSFKNDRPIWFSDEVMEIIKDKDTLMQRAIQTKDEDERRIARQA